MTVLRQDAGEQAAVKLLHNEYNEKGDAVRIAQFDEDGKTVVSILERTYDDQGNTILEVLTVEGQELQRVETAYLENGKLAEKKMLVEGNQLDHHLKYTWNSTYTEAKLAYLDEEGNVAQQEFHTYDEQGNVLAERFIDEDGSELEACQYAYDEKGNLVKKIENQGGFEMTTTYKNQYNEGGLLISAVSTDEDGDEEVEEYEYFEDGTKKMEAKTNVNGAREVTYFDEKGRRKKELRYDETEFLVLESSSFYGEEHDFPLYRNERKDRKVYKLIFEYEMYEA